MSDDRACKNPSVIQMLRADPRGAEILAQHEILRADPQRYVDMMTALIQSDPSRADHHYFSRHQGWRRLKRYDLALEDLDRAIALRPHYIHHRARGTILADLGRHEDALADFAKGEALDPEMWKGAWGYLHQATSFAALGHEKHALAACEKMPDDTWSPGLHGTPSGNKAQITEEIRRRARAARPSGRS